MNTRNLHKVSIVTASGLFLLAAAFGVMRMMDMAVTSTALALAVSVVLGHLRHRLALEHVSSRAEALADLNARELSRIADLIRASQEQSATELAGLSVHATALVEALEIHVDSAIASSESIVVADLMTLRHRMGPATTSHEFG